MNVTFVISSLGSGGAERVMSTIANHLVARGHEITLLTLAPAHMDFYELHPDVRRVALGFAPKPSGFVGGLPANLRRMSSLRREIQASQPDTVVSFIWRTNVLTLLAAFGTHIPVVVCERTDPTRHSDGGAWRLLRRLLYPRAGAVIVQTGGHVREWAESFVHEDRVHVVPNPALPPVHVEQDNVSGPSSGRAVAMGRLAPVKGFDLLIRAFARCARDHPGWSLTILGDGTERPHLENLANNLGIYDRLHMPGRVKEPADTLRSADLFVLSSRYEGFPNALLEAMSCGLPVISFDCPSGPRDIVRHGVDGLLVEDGDVDALADAMGRMMGSEAQRARMGARAIEVVDRFGLEKVMGMWEDVVDTVIKRSRP